MAPKKIIFSALLHIAVAVILPVLAIMAAIGYISQDSTHEFFAGLVIIPVAAVSLTLSYLYSKKWLSQIDGQDIGEAVPLFTIILGLVSAGAIIGLYTTTPDSSKLISLCFWSIVQLVLLCISFRVFYRVRNKSRLTLAVTFVIVALITCTPVIWVAVQKSYEHTRIERGDY